MQLYNTRTDVQLLSDLEVRKCFWPIDLKQVAQQSSSLDAAYLCATAKSKYYASAIDKLQSLR